MDGWAPPQLPKRNHTRLILLIVCALIVLGGAFGVNNVDGSATPTTTPNICTRAQTDSTNPFVSDKDAEEAIRQCWLTSNP